jgi:hypothetical protein
MMKKILFTTILILLSTKPLYARDFGLGAILGSPTGISGKYNLDNERAIDGTISYGSHELVLYGDYLKHYPGLFGKQNEFIASLRPYVGVGPMFVFSDGDKDHSHKYTDDDDDSFAFGGRIPLGVEWLSKEIPLGVSLELAPGITVLPGTDAFVQGGLAIRYYFK